MVKHDAWHGLVSVVSNNQILLTPDTAQRHMPRSCSKQGTTEWSGEREVRAVNMFSLLKTSSSIFILKTLSKEAFKHMQSVSPPKIGMLDCKLNHALEQQFESSSIL